MTCSAGVTPPRCNTPTSGTSSATCTCSCLERFLPPSRAPGLEGLPWSCRRRAIGWCGRLVLGAGTHVAPDARRRPDECRGDGSVTRDDYWAHHRPGDPDR